MAAGTIARVTVRLLPDAPALEHADSVQVLAHTAAVEARAFFAAPEDAPGLPPGELFADLELAEPLALVPGMRLLLRRPSPACNLGVARFLGFGRHRLRRRDAEERTHWLGVARALDQPEELALRVLEASGGSPKRAEEVAQSLGWTPAAARLELEGLERQARARALGKDAWIAAGSTEAIFAETRGVMEHFRGRNPERLLIPIQRFRDRLGKEGFAVLEKMPDEQLEGLGLRRRRGSEWQLLGAEVPAAVRADAERLYAAIEGGALAPADWPALLAATQLTEVRGVAARVEERSERGLLGGRGQSLRQDRRRVLDARAEHRRVPAQRGDGAAGQHLPYVAGAREGLRARREAPEPALIGEGLAIERQQRHALVERARAELVSERGHARRAQLERPL
ncbi:MAG: hypothetical protein AAB295_11955, partial [Chloroflexota bacterium]